MLQDLPYFLSDQPSGEILMTWPKSCASHKKAELPPMDYLISLNQQRIIILGGRDIPEGHKWNRIAKASVQGNESCEALCL